MGLRGPAVGVEMTKLSSPAGSLTRRPKLYTPITISLSIVIEFKT